MSEDKTLDQLNRDVRYLLDRSEILDCISRHQYAVMTVTIRKFTTSAYHDDGVDEHGSAVTPAAEYAEWINFVHVAGSQIHTHNITTHLCEIEGDTAHCESERAAVPLES